MDIRLYMKFGEKEHLEKMQKEGIFYCNTITYFANLEDKFQGDSFESVTKLEYRENIIIHLKESGNPASEWKKLQTSKLLYKEYYKEPLGNLFCFSAFKIIPKKESSIFKFTDGLIEKFKYGLLILRQDIFMDKLNTALSKLQFKTFMSPIEYIDLHKHTGKKTLFQKDLAYSDQEEFRILLYTDKYKQNDPFEFSIGNIEDISELVDLRKTKGLHYKL